MRREGAGVEVIVAVEVVVEVGGMAVLVEVGPPGVSVGGTVVAVAVAAPHVFSGDWLFRGIGTSTEKSAALFSVSVQPALMRRAAVVLLKVPVGPVPSKQLAVVP